MLAEYQIIVRLERGPSASKLDLVSELGLPESEIEAGIIRLYEKGFIKSSQRDDRVAYRLSGQEQSRADLLSL